MSEKRSGVLPLVVAVALFAAGVAAFALVREPSGPTLRSGSAAPDFALPVAGGVEVTLAALLGAAGALFYDADNGLRAVFHLGFELDEADLRLDRLREERAELLLRAERLRSDPFEIETVARESLGMARPGEIVVRLPRSPALPERISD